MKNYNAIKILNLFIIVLFLITTTAANANTLSEESVLTETTDDVGTIEEFDPSTQSADEFFQSSEIEFQDDFSDSTESSRSQFSETTGARTITLPAAARTRWSDKLQMQFNQYSNHPRITQLIEEARQNLRQKSYILKRYDPARKIHYRVAYCYRAVKDALLGAGFVNRYLEGSEARMAIPILEKVGFKNLMNNPNYANVFARHPEMAPRGTLLIFRNNPNYKPCVSGCSRPHIAGHIEIKTQDSGQHGYISVSESRKPTYGYAVPQLRELIGVMYKERL